MGRNKKKNKDSEVLELTEQEEDELIQAMTLGLAQDSAPGWRSDHVVYHGSANRSILVSGEINQELADGITSQIHQLEKEGDEPITVHINTPGGSVVDGFAIYDLLKCVRAPIITMVTGACFSAGLIILAAGDLRLATPSSAFFYHQPIMDPGQIFSTETVDSALHSYKWSQKKLDATIRDRAGLSKRKWKKHFKDRISKHFDTKQALKYGIIDEVITYAEKPKLSLGDPEWLSQEEELD